VTRRLLASYLAITLTVLVILTIPMGATFQRQKRQELTNTLVQRAFLIASQLEESVDQAKPDSGNEEWVRTFTKDSELRVVAVTTDGTVVLDSQRGGIDGPVDNMANRPEIAALFAEREVQTGERLSNTLGKKLTFVVAPVVREGNIIGAVRLTFPSDATKADVNRYWLIIGVTGLISLALVAALGVVLSRSIARPIKELERAAADFGSGQLDRRAPDVGGPPEVASLRNAFNTTAAGLERLVKRQQTFVADASHQLRTPLTGLRLRLEGMESEVTEAGQDDLENALDQTDRLSRLVDGLLMLARADRPATWNDSQPLVLKSSLQARINDWEPFATERSITLSMSCSPELIVVVNPDRFSQVLDNLIANAFDALSKTDRDQPQVQLVAKPFNDVIDIHIMDNGPGLTPAQRARAFDRFWRADPSHTDGFGGTGLGLSIAASMLANDKGSIRLEAAPISGLDAVVTLRRADSDVRHPHPKTPTRKQRHDGMS
jgi:signal transduction histidine kinase